MALCCLSAFAKGPAGTATVSGPTYNGAVYQTGKLVMKVKPSFRYACSDNAINESSVLSVLNRYNSGAMAKKFPHAKMPAQQFSRTGKKLVDLSLVYQVNTAEDVQIEKLIADLMSTGVLEYAEPLYMNYLDYTPNDPLVSNQYHINRISCYTAWDVWKGDTNTVIGIIDSGTDWDHPDLAGNIKYNYNDPIDGVDNDNDGFVDNYRGWDVSGNDNNPIVVASDHGSHVSGCAAAVTDNGTGVASPGFNCKFLPIKASLDASATAINNGYDGITYGADHGCHVLNCSWGRSGGFSQFEQDVINYAAINNDVLVVAAAGNSGLEIDHYPSAYENVTAVAATGTSDSKASYSNYGYFIDVCAPGTNVRATVFDDSYVTMTGTSMASPVAAGCAAMIRSRWPSMTAEQAAMQLRITCDNIANATGNSAFPGKLGKGRVNLFRALTDSISPGVRVEELTIRDRNDNVFVANDTLDMVALVKNVLRPTTNLVCSLTTTSTFVSILQNTHTFGALNTFDTASNYNNSYRVRILPTSPTNQEVAFRLRIIDGSFTDDYYFKVTVNVDYLNIAINDVATSVTSRGLIGYNGSGQVQGIGFLYTPGTGDTTILYEGGLMIGASGTQVSDNNRGDGATYDSDWSPFINIVGSQPGTLSDYDATSYFFDNNSSSPMQISVRQNSYAWIPAPDSKYIIMQYWIKNTSAVTYSGVSAGIFADWDVPNYANNKASLDAGRRMGYIWSTDQDGVWAGIKALNPNGTFNCNSIDNITGGSGGLNLSDGFSNVEKYASLTTTRADAGGASTGNDVIHVVSMGGYTIAPGDSVEVAFALIAGDNLADIQASADAAQSKYDNVITNLTQLDVRSNVTALNSVFPNPAQSGITIDFSLAASSLTNLSVFSMKGELVKEILNDQLTPGKYSFNTDVSSLPAGNYLVRMMVNGYSKSIPVNVVR